MYIESALVVLVSMASALVAEAASWLLIYRTETYKTLSKEIERLNAKLEKAKEKLVPIHSKKQKDKQISFLDEQLKSKSRDLTVAKFKSGIFVMMMMIASLALLNREFDGRPVAKLPFTPVPLIRGITHRNLPGYDFTDCSMTFLYVLCSMSFRGSIQKLLGFSPPKTPSNFFMPAMEK